jgi:hypothetical protein
MNIDPNTRNTLELVASIMIRAFALCVVFLSLVFVVILVCGDLIYPLHNSLFQITRLEFNVEIYSWLGSFKLAAFVLFLIPYLAIRWTLKSANTE